MIIKRNALFLSALFVAVQSSYYISPYTNTSTTTKGSLQIWILLPLLTTTVDCEIYYTSIIMLKLRLLQSSIDFLMIGKWKAFYYD
jgi:hypothetical protein